LICKILAVLYKINLTNKKKMSMKAAFLSREVNVYRLGKPALTLLLMFAIAITSFSQITINGSGSYATIQAAINAASSGDIIDVPAGIYDETPTNAIVTINKPLTIRGANSGISAGRYPGVRGPESELNGRFTINTGSTELTIDGFTINSTLTPFSRPINVIISNSPTGNINLKNNIFNGANLAGSGAISSTRNDVTWNLTDNSFTNFISTNISIAGNVGAGTISGNLFTSTAVSGNSATMVSFPNTVLTGQIITDNRFVSVNTGQKAFSLASGNHDINKNQFEGPGGPAITAASDNNSITENIFLNTSSVFQQTGTRTGNTLYHNSFLGGATATSVLIIGTTNSVVSASCNWWGTTTPPTTRINNATQVVMAPWLLDGTDADAGTAGFQTNELCSAPCDLQLTTSVTDEIACANGTASVSILSGGTGNYTYSWNTVPVQTTPSISDLIAGIYTVTVQDANGCSAMETAIVVNALTGPVRNVTSGINYCTIQAAVTAASPDDVIEVDAGTYNEALITINKPLTLKGANAGISIGISPGVRGPETIINGGLRTSAVNGVLIIDGFTINAIASGGNGLNCNLGGTGEIYVLNNYMDGNKFTNTRGIYTGINVKWHVEGNTITRYRNYGILLDAPAPAPSPGLGTFKGNVISNNTTGGMIIQSSVSTPQIITENYFDSCGIIVGAGGGGHTFSRNTFVGPRVAIQNNSNNNTYFENNFHTNNIGINSGVTTGNVAYHNSFTRVGTNILASFGSELDATCNWYGTTTPINRVFGGPNVTFLPWLIDGTDADPSTPGFQTISPCFAPCDLQLNTSSTPDSICFSGSASVSVASGGSGNYTYTWNTTPTQTTSDVSGLVAGTYTVSVNDLNGCSASTQVTVVNSLTSGPVQNTNTGVYYCTIQSAINDTLTLNGHTITVAPGIYPENIVSGKNVILLGANAGVKAGKYAEPRGPESIIEGSIQVGGLGLVPAPTGFTLDGFTVKATPTSVIGSAANRRLFYSFSIASGASFLVTNNILDGDFQGRNLPGCGSGINCAGATGIFGGNDANWTVTNNSLSNFHYWAILVDGTLSTGTYSGNLITDNLGGNPGFAGGGILFQSSLTVGQSVIDNKFVNNVPSVVLGSGNHTISQNLFESTRGIYAASANNSVTENFFVNSLSYAFWLDAARTGNVLYHNSLVGGPSPQVYGSTGGIVTATCNWWNSTDPAVVGPKANSFVEKLPWLTDGTDADASTPGFQTTAICNVPCDVELEAEITHPGCNPEGSVILTATGGTGVYLFSGDSTSGLTEGLYNYTVTDANGCSTSIIVELVGQADTTPPTAICRDVVVTLVNGVASVTVDDINNGSFDECGIALITLSQYSWTCLNIGENTITMTVTDENNNISTCEAIVEVDGSIPDVTIISSTLPNFCQGSSIVLTATTDEPVTYYWNNGSTSDDINVNSNGTYEVEVTNDNGCTNIDIYYVIDFDASELTSAYTIIAFKEVHLHGTINVLNGGVGLTSTNSGDKLKLHDKTQVVGSTTFVTGGNIEITGSSSASVQNSYPAVVSLPPFASNPYPGTFDVKVPDNATVTLTDSIYKKLEIGKNATVTLSSKNIYAQEFIVRENATVKFAGCANVIVKKKVVFEKFSKFNLEQNGVTIYVEDGGTSVEWNEGAVFYGKVYAPNGDIKSDGGKVTTPILLNGQFIGYKVELKGFTTVNWDLNCDPSCFPSPQPECVCLGGINELTFEYSQWDVNSPQKSNVTFYSDAALTQVIKVFKDVTNGKTLKVSAKDLPGKVFGAYIYAVVAGNSSEIITIPSTCGSDIVGEFYRELYIYAQKDLFKSICAVVQDCGLGKTLMCHAPIGKDPHTHCVKNKDVAKKLEKSDWYLGECVTFNTRAGGKNDSEEILDNNANEIELFDYAVGLSAAPNPFTHSTKISFTISERDFVRLVVFNAIGQEVARLYEGFAESGLEYGFDFNAGNNPSGMYFYSLETSDGRIYVEKIVLSK
jgi:hypothetical protein